MLTTFIAVAILVACDQAIKYWTLVKLAYTGVGSTDFIPGLLRLTYVENRGAAFGMGQTLTWLFTIITILVVTAIFILLMRLGKKTPALLRISLTLISAGGIGNLVDRIARGFVVDMFETEFVDFAIFNFADALVTCGTVLLFIFILFFYDKHFPDRGNIGAERTDEVADPEKIDPDMTAEAESSEAGGDTVTDAQASSESSPADAIGDTTDKDE